MKNLVFIVLLTLVLSACWENSQNIEVLENDNEIYFNENQVDKHALPISQSKDYKLIDDLKKIIKKLHDNTKNKEIYYPISYKVFINDKGEIDKIMDYNNYMIRYLREFDMGINGEVKEKNIFTNTERITKLILPFFEKLRYTPAIYNGKNIPFQTMFKIYGKVDINGEMTLEISGLPTVNSDHKGNINLEDYFVTVEEMPSPIGGMRAIQEKVRYPEIAKRAGVEGRVYVKAFIDEKGNVVETEILRGVGQGLDEAAIEAIKAVKFNPGKQRGKPVKVQVSIPIMFKLN